MATTGTTKDLNGAALQTTSTTLPQQFAYDNYGNLLYATVSTTAGGETVSTTTSASYDNLTTNWHIGLLRRTQITKSQSGKPTIARTATIDYDTTGLVSRETVEPNDVTYKLQTDYVRDAFGNITRKTLGWTDPATATARQRDSDRLTFDARGRWATQRTNALNQSETRAYDDSYGNLLTLTGPNALATSWEYDGFGRKTRENRADGTATTWGYRRCIDTCNYGAVTALVTQQWSGSTQIVVPSERFADSLGRAVQTRTWGYAGTPIYSQRVYDSLGRLQAATRPFFAGATPVSTTFGYDDLGRKTLVVEPSSSGGTRQSSLAYNGLASTTTNAKSQTRTTTRNLFGKPKQIIDAGGYATTYEYDVFANLTRTIDAKGNQINITYDKLGRKTQLVDPDLGIRAEEPQCRTSMKSSRCRHGC